HHAVIWKKRGDGFGGRLLRKFSTGLGTPPLAPPVYMIDAKIALPNLQRSRFIMINEEACIGTGYKVLISAFCGVYL
ncbi:hypothetical protein, partial [Stutzerimonas kunmingensis]|uniref:hypothetical protein n=1 Tax=Stutzerimonas kunmingensis TaxID=1211807 RepID=UPI0028A590F0